MKSQLMSGSVFTVPVQLRDNESLQFSQSFTSYTYLFIFPYSTCSITFCFHVYAFHLTVVLDSVTVSVDLANWVLGLCQYAKWAGKMGGPREHVKVKG